MVFQLGASSYFLGDYGETAEVFSSHIERMSEDNAPFAYLMLIDSLNEIGEKGEATRYLKTAEDMYGDTDFSRDFAELGSSM